MYHVNPATGEPGKCRATKKPCPYGGDDVHYTSKEAARQAFEESQKPFENSHATHRQMEVWANRARTESSPVDSLGSPDRKPRFTEDHLNKARKEVRKRIGWDELGSSAKDMAENSLARILAKVEATDNWRDSVKSKAENSEWVSKLDDSNLNRLARILSGPSVAHRAEFDKGNHTEKASQNVFNEISRRASKIKVSS